MQRLQELPLSRITVRMICEDCEINHNTFYYYYGDIYAVIHEFFEENLRYVEEVYVETDSWEQSFIRAVQPALEYRTALYHIYHSLRREDLERYVYQVGRDVMRRFLHRIHPEIAASEGDRDLLAHFFCCALTEMVMQWVARGMREDPELFINRVGFLLDGTIEEALRRSAAEGKPGERFCLEEQAGQEREPARGRRRT